MIDLRKQLPEALEVEGSFFSIKTDYRTWIDWLDQLEGGTASYSIFEDEIPSGDAWVQAAMDFAMCEPATPRTTGKASPVKAVDFVRDGDYILGSFQHVYGIDLLTTDMHWHRFLALFRSLPEQAKMSEVMGYRLFRESDVKAKPVDRYKKARQAWTLPAKKSQDIIDWQQEAFGNIQAPAE